MSTQLTKARAGLAQIPGYMKQDKVLLAAIAMQDALTTMLKEALMKAEKEEFTDMVSKAVRAMDSNKELRTLYPLQFNYEPGKERELLNAIRELLQALNEQQAAVAQDRLAELEKTKEAALAKGQEYLDANERNKAKAHFAKITKEFSDLKGEAGEMFLKAEMYEEAIEYLGQALEDSPTPCTSITASASPSGKWDALKPRKHTTARLWSSRKTTRTSISIWAVCISNGKNGSAWRKPPLSPSSTVRTSTKPEK